MAIPAATFIVPLADILTTTFFDHLVHQRDSAAPLSKCCSEIRKAGVEHVEKKFEVVPTDVLDWLLPTIARSTHDSKEYHVSKSVRTDIYNGKQIWRRSPLWIGTKAVLQLILSIYSPVGKVLYKSTMLNFLSRVAASNVDTSVVVGDTRERLIKISKRVDKITPRMIESTDPVISRTIEDCQAIDKYLKTQLDALCKTDQVSKQFGPIVKDIMSNDYSSCLTHLFTKVKATLADLQHHHTNIKITSVIASEPQPTHWSEIKLSDVNISTIHSEIQSARGPSDIGLALYTAEILIGSDLWTNRERIMSSENLYNLMTTYSNVAQSRYRDDPVCLSGILLLNTREQHIQLEQVVRYFSNRTEGSNSSLEDSIFGVTESGLPYKWASVNLSPTLKRRREEDDIKKQRKASEIQSLQANQSIRMEDARKNYNNAPDPDDPATSYSDSLLKARYQREFNSIQEEKAQVFERSLPDCDIDAYVALFYQHTPQAFLYARDAMALLAQQCLLGSCFVSSGCQTLWPSEGQSNLIGLGSNAKLVMSTPYSSQRLYGAQPLSFVVPCGMKVTNSVYTSSKSSIPSVDFWNINTKCTIQAPAKSLQWMVNGMHSENDVIASQCNTLVTMTESDYINFGMLRTGGNIQLRNMARSIDRRLLDLNVSDVYALFFQAMYQVGPYNLTTSLFDWRQDHHDQILVDYISSSVTKYVESIRKNWEQTHALAILTMLLTCIAHISEVTNKDLVYNAIRLCRAIALEWMFKIFDIIAKNLKENKTVEADTNRVHLVFTCIIVILTYDGSKEHLHNSENDGQDSIDLIRAVSYWSGSSNGTLGVWKRYQNSNYWHTTLTRVNEQPINVHIDLQEGVFLVNMAPNNRLPQEIEQSAVYKDIFGVSIFEVKSSGHKKWKMNHPLIGHAYYEFIISPSNTVGIIEHDREDIRYHVPRANFEGEVPEQLCTNHSHWIHVGELVPHAKTIEFRATSFLNFGQPPTYYGSLTTGTIETLTGQKVMSFNSAKCDRIKHMFCRIEMSQYIHVLYVTESCSIVHLPRYGLDFIVEPAVSSYLSRQHQETKSTLQLRSPPYFSYDIDQEFRYLRATDILPQLFIAYLHVVTSSCLPDPFTGFTGLEAAMEALQRFHSNVPFSPECREILLEISRISPVRNMYPPRGYDSILQTVTFSGFTHPIPWTDVGNEEVNLVSNHRWQHHLTPRMKQLTTNSIPERSYPPLIINPLSLSQSVIVASFNPIRFSSIQQTILELDTLWEHWLSLYHLAHQTQQGKLPLLQLKFILNFLKWYFDIDSQFLDIFLAIGEAPTMVKFPVVPTIGRYSNPSCTYSKSSIKDLLKSLAKRETDRRNEVNRNNDRIYRFNPKDQPIQLKVDDCSYTHYKRLYKESVPGIFWSVDADLGDKCPSSNTTPTLSSGLPNEFHTWISEKVRSWFNNAILKRFLLNLSKACQKLSGSHVNHPFFSSAPMPHHIEAIPRHIPPIQTSVPANNDSALWQKGFLESLEVLFEKCLNILDTHDKVSENSDLFVRSLPTTCLSMETFIYEDLQNSIDSLKDKFSKQKCHELAPEKVVMESLRKLKDTTDVESTRLWETIQRCFSPLDSDMVGQVQTMAGVNNKVNTAMVYHHYLSADFTDKDKVNQSLIAVIGAYILIRSYRDKAIRCLNKTGEDLIK
eukprot:gene17536-20926_t